MFVNIAPHSFEPFFLVRVLEGNLHHISYMRSHSFGLLLDLVLEVERWRRTEFTTDGAVNPDRVPASSPEKLQAQTKICIFWNPAKLQAEQGFPRLNFFSLVSAVSNPKEPKTSTNFCILCAVREELTYICRVCLTKFIL